MKYTETKKYIDLLNAITYNTGIDGKNLTLYKDFRRSFDNIDTRFKLLKSLDYSVLASESLDDKINDWLLMLDEKHLCNFRREKAEEVILGLTTLAGHFISRAVEFQISGIWGEDELKFYQWRVSDWIYETEKRLNEFREAFPHLVSPGIGLNTVTKTINKDELDQYFKPKFKGMGNTTINYLAIFIEHLQVPRTAKAYAQIALMCYEGAQMNDLKPKSFSRWYEIFCKAVGCERKTYDNKNKLREDTPESLKTLFVYLRQ